ncbi:reverse transcriptase [Plakobranchus ocellatus]|uniref:Reverse transcriptase n=1 Tax=Plakobranchus ocellatus TaxID=259542 RepID=A0AAV4D7I4_9GAST|nr:reverse transcriptase [Plakobranchus ocellatus]
MPPLKIFIKDTAILCFKDNETRRILVQLDILMNKSRIIFKPQSCRSLSLRKGELGKDVCFKIASQDIPRLSQEPFKSLRRWVDHFRKAPSL